MKTHCTFTALLVAFAILLAQGSPARAQGNAQEASEMLRALNIQIGEAKLAGNDARVRLLQNRYTDIQKKWGVRPAGAPQRLPERLPPPVPVNTTWADVRKGDGKITGYQGGKIPVRSAAVTIASFWDPYHQPNVTGKGATLKFTTYDGRVFTYTGNWTWRGNLTVTLNVTDGEGGFYKGSMNMDKEGISTISLIGYGGGDGYNITFSH